MVIFPSTNQTFTVTLQADAASGTTVAAYSRSKSMMRLKREDSEVLSTFAVNINGEGWRYYYTDPTGAVEIPLHNDVARYLGTTGFVLAIRLLDFGTTSPVIDQAIIIVECLEGVSYNEIDAPRNKDFNGTLYAFSHACILPPNVMLNPATAGGTTGKGIIVESNYHTLDPDAAWLRVAGGISATVVPNGDRSNQLVIPAGADILRLATGKDADIIKDYRMEHPDYCTDLVCVRWTSLTEATRQHYFPIVGFVKGNGEQVALVSPGDGYEVSKANFTAIHCRLDGLTRYGYWYYMDMIQASDLHAVVYPTASNFETEIASAQTAAFVDAASMETPTGNGFYSFDFTINIRQYGKV